MNILLGCVESRIVFHREYEVHQIAASSIEVNEFKEAWNKQDVYNIVTNPFSNSSEIPFEPSNTWNQVPWKFWNGDLIFFNFEKQKEKQPCIKLRLMLTMDSSSEYSDSYITILFRKIQWVSEEIQSVDFCRELFYRLRNILFMRSTLLEILWRKLYTLIHYDNDYSYICMNSDKETKSACKIIHISDIHASEKEKESIVSLLEELEKDDVAVNKLSADLLVITGDVAQGAHNVDDFVKHYAIAAEIIKKIASFIFAVNKNGKKCVLHDWRKRIIIIPGNHDYVSTGDLQTSFKPDRSVSYAQVADLTGTIMSRFNSYIDFVRGLLDVDIGDLIDNGLNEVRVYRNLNTRIICLNSIANANSKKTNRVGFDIKTINNLLSGVHSFDDSSFRNIVAVHHGPSYQIDYIYDTFYDPYLLKCESDKESFQISNDGTNPTIPHVNREERTKSDSSVLSVETLAREYLTQFKTILESYLYDNRNNLDIRDGQICFNVQDSPESKSIQDKRKESTLSTYLCSKDISLDEFDFSILLNHSLSERDNKQFKNDYQKIVGQLGDKCVFICGHTHSDNTIQKFIDKFPVYEIGRFYTDSYLIRDLGVNYPKVGDRTQCSVTFKCEEEKYLHFFRLYFEKDSDCEPEIKKFDYDSSGRRGGDNLA